MCVFRCAYIAGFYNLNLVQFKVQTRDVTRFEQIESIVTVPSFILTIFVRWSRPVSKTMKHNNEKGDEESWTRKGESVYLYSGGGSNCSGE